MGETQVRSVNLSDKVVLKRLREHIESMLKPLAENMRVVAKTGGIKYEGDGSACTVQLKCCVMDASGRVVPQYEKDFNHYCHLFDDEGLKAEHLHAEVLWGGNRFEIVGLKPNAGKFPLVAKRLDTGKNFCLPMDAIKHIKEAK